MCWMDGCEGGSLSLHNTFVESREESSNSKQTSLQASIRLDTVADSERATTVWTFSLVLALQGKNP